MSWTWQQYSADNAWDDEVSLASLLERPMSMRANLCAHESACRQRPQREAGSWELEVQRSQAFLRRVRIELDRERRNGPIVTGFEDDDGAKAHSLKAAAPRRAGFCEQERSRIYAQAIGDADQSRRELHRCRVEKRALRTQLNEAVALAEAKEISMQRRAQAFKELSLEGEQMRSQLVDLSVEVRSWKQRALMAEQAEQRHAESDVLAGRRADRLSSEVQFLNRRSKLLRNLLFDEVDQSERLELVEKLFSDSEEERHAALKAAELNQSSRVDH